MTGIWELSGVERLNWRVRLTKLLVKVSMSLWAEVGFRLMLSPLLLGVALTRLSTLLSVSFDMMRLTVSLRIQMRWGTLFPRVPRNGWDVFWAPFE